MMWAAEKGFIYFYIPPQEGPHLSQLLSPTTKCEW